MSKEKRGIGESSFLFIYWPIAQADHVHEHKGRPSKELYAMPGLMILQQMHDLTDEEATTQFAFNRQLHYPLNFTGPFDEETYVCVKTVWSISH